VSEKVFSDTVDWLKRIRKYLGDTKEPSCIRGWKLPPVCFGRN